VVIKREDFLFGIRHWVQFYAHRVPRMEVFRYVGVDKNLGIYYFQSVTHKTIIGRNFYQLNMNGFRPFLLDIKRIQEEMNKTKGINNAYV
jgi:hypothetical protein